jgi:hypothetical protein
MMALYKQYKNLKADKRNQEKAKAIELVDTLGNKSLKTILKSLVSDESNATDEIFSHINHMQSKQLDLARYKKDARDFHYNEDYEDLNELLNDADPLRVQFKLSLLFFIRFAKMF